MRVSSGSLRGRAFDAPKGFRTRPMADRVKTALFNTLGNVSGDRILDAYAGSGALGFEAVSRGAEFVQFVELDRQASVIINKNITALKVEDSTKMTQANVSSWSDRNVDTKFDLIICDPPYDRIHKATLDKLARHLTPGGRLVLSHPGKTTPPDIEGLVLDEVRQYGDAALAYYEMEA